MLCCRERLPIESYTVRLLTPFELMHKSIGKNTVGLCAVSLVFLGKYTTGCTPPTFISLHRIFMAAVEVVVDIHCAELTLM